jgi:colanic acid/amylovoran biosynthesis glycosyltransferase
VHHSITAKDGDTEGIPTVIMEAMATGLPVVSTWHAGIPELVEDGVSGRLVKERDEEAYSSFIYELAGNQSERIRLGREARKKIESDFNMDKQNVLLKELYKNLLGTDNDNFS